MEGGSVSASASGDFCCCRVTAPWHDVIMHARNGEVQVRQSQCCEESRDGRADGPMVHATPTPQVQPG